MDNISGLGGFAFSLYRYRRRVAIGIGSIVPNPETAVAHSDTMAALGEVDRLGLDLGPLRELAEWQLRNLEMRAQGGLAVTVHNLAERPLLVANLGVLLPDKSAISPGPEMWSVSPPARLEAAESVTGYMPWAVLAPALARFERRRRIRAFAKLEGVRRTRSGKRLRISACLPHEEEDSRANVSEQGR